jgi:uncharacterized OsmC-like protein
MSTLDSYLDRKKIAMAQREAEWSAAPHTAVATIRASSKVGGSTGTRPTSMGDYIIISDSGPGLAGNSLGPTSPEMLLGALGSCLVHTYLIQACLLDVTLNDINIEVEATLDYKPVIGMPGPTPPILSDIRYRADVDSAADPGVIEALHRAVEQNCPVLNTLRNPVSVQRQP